MTQSWKVILAFTGIFIAGAIAGGFISVNWARKEHASKIMAAKPPTLEQFGKNHLAQMSKRLELTQAQQEQVKPLIDQSSEELKALRKHTLVESIAIFTRFEAEVEKILTPEQKKRFEDFRKQQRDRLKMFLGGRREGTGPGSRRQGPPPEQGELPPPPRQGI